jgi:hypothetical protein
VVDRVDRRHLIGAGQRQRGGAAPPGGEPSRLYFDSATSSAWLMPESATPTLVALRVHADLLEQSSIERLAARRFGTLTHASDVLAPSPSRGAADPTQPRFAAPYANPNAVVEAL